MKMYVKDLLELNRIYEEEGKTLEISLDGECCWEVEEGQVFICSNHERKLLDKDVVEVEGYTCLSIELLNRRGQEIVSILNRGVKGF